MNYTTHTEDFVKELYLKIDITKPHQLNYKTIANALGIRVFPAPYDGPSQALLFNVEENDIDKIPNVMMDVILGSFKIIEAGDVIVTPLAIYFE